MTASTFLVHPLRTYGPDPAEFWFNHSVALSTSLALGASVPPWAATVLASRMPVGTAARAARNATFGAVRTTRTVWSSTTTTSLTSSMKNAGLSLRFLRRMKENFTSWAVRGFPEANFTPRRSTKVYVVPSAESSHRVASLG